MTTDAHYQISQFVQSVVSVDCGKGVTIVKGDNVWYVNVSSYGHTKIDFSFFLEAMRYAKQVVQILTDLQDMQQCLQDSVASGDPFSKIEHLVNKEE